jgi:transglutaminase-like putative cysteine protease
MKRILISCLFYAVSQSCLSQLNILDASTLSVALKEKAHSVKREEKISFEVKDIGEAKLSVHQVFTVLDPEGEDVLFFIQYSDQFRKLDNAEIKVYDAQGKPVNKYKMKEMKSQATGDGLVEDGKVYYFRVAAAGYPVTVQFDYQVKYKGTLNYPDYQIMNPDQSVEYSNYTATVPVDLDLKYKAQNISLTPSVNTSGKNKLYTWEVKNLIAMPYESGAVSYKSSYPSVLIAPNKFSMDGNEGDLSTWQNFGSWYANLSKGSINFSAETKSFLKKMVAEAKDDKEKIKILYDYLQNNFRYVSIQLGIGGFKPFDADFVDKKKYGDCKALSNYMKACLDAVGITSYPALINAEYNKAPVDPAFPHNSFNHVILCVPGKNDTTWLECTSTTTDAGVLGNFTENRNALIITPGGGVLVATPKSKPSDNAFNLTTKIILNENASGESESILKTSGKYKEDIIHYIVDEKKDDQKKYLVNQLGFLQPDDLELKIDRKDSLAKTSFKLLIEKVPEFSVGNKMFLNPRIYKIWNSTLPTTEKRTKAFYFPCPFIKTDTTIYQLPENYAVENLPKARDKKFEYGVFKTKYLFDEKTNSVTSIAYLLLSQHIIPAEKFDETRKFFNYVTEEYSEKIVIKKK